MVTLASLATAGLVLGIFFNVYALAGSCVAVVLLNFASAFDVGISPHNSAGAGGCSLNI